MKISYRWLSRHVDLAGVSPERVAELLTLHTAEVEHVERFAPALETVVVAHVVERARHPDADKLSVCQVDLGTGETVQIVCGAPNVAQGQKVAVAAPGAVLPGDFKIKVSKIRGQESRGMICSERELGLGDEHDGIWVLPADAPVGQPVAQALGLADWIIEIDNKSLTHRPDLWGHRGIARELAALLGRELRPIPGGLPAPRAQRSISTAIETTGCVRYQAVLIGGVQNGRAPDWMRHLLLAAGQRPIDRLVDVSNFAMLDLGQPNHFFDAAAVAGEVIRVREARAGESLATLDGTERSLVAGDLLICAGERPIALAGVMGGAGSKVHEGTLELILELATFRPTPVRRTSARLALRSESSARFEKTLDPALIDDAGPTIFALLAELCPEAHLLGAPSEAGDWRRAPLTVVMRPARVSAVLGANIEPAKQREVLTRLGFAVAERGLEWTVTVPSWRATKDIAIEEDLIEEIGRTVGYAALGEAQLTAKLAPAPANPRRELVRRLQDRLAGAARFAEVQTYSFLPDPLARALGLGDAPHVEVQNPIAEGWQRIRRSVAPSLIGLLAANLRERDEVALFEIGKGYLPEHANARGEPRERHELALVLAAPTQAEGRHALFGALARLRGAVESAVSASGATVPAWQRAGAVSGLAPVSWAHPARAAVLGDGAAPLAFAAELDPRIKRALGIEGDAAAAVVDIDVLLAMERPGARHKPLPRFPGLTLDVALAAPEDVPAGELEALIRVSGKGLVDRTLLFDLFRGGKLGEGRKSLGFHVTLQAADRTLEEGDLAKFLDRLGRAAEAKGCELRRE